MAEQKQQDDGGGAFVITKLISDEDRRRIVLPYSFNQRVDDGAPLYDSDELAEIIYGATPDLVTKRAAAVELLWRIEAELFAELSGIPEKRRREQEAK